MLEVIKLPASAIKSKCQRFLYASVLANPLETDLLFDFLYRFFDYALEVFILIFR